MSKGKVVFIGLILLFVIWLLVPNSGVPILAYHQVSTAAEIYAIDPEEFEQHMKYLAGNGYTAISLADLFAARKGAKHLPEKPVVITFDDGYEDNYKAALPIMEKYGMRATVFVIAGQVGQSGYMSWDQIKAMRARGTEIGSHTYSHVALSDIGDMQLSDELSRSKQVLEANMGTRINFLAYPFGQYNSQTIAALERIGYQGALTGLPGLGGLKGDAYQLKRVNVPRPKYGLWEFRLRLARAELYAKFGL